MTTALFIIAALVWSIAFLWVRAELAKDGLTIKQALIKYFKILAKELEESAKAVRTREALHRTFYDLTIGDQLYQVDTEYNRAMLYGQLVDVEDDYLVIKLQGADQQVRMHILDYGDEVMALAKAEAIVKERAQKNDIKHNKMMVDKKVNYVRTLINNNGIR